MEQILKPIKDLDTDKPMQKVVEELALSVLFLVVGRGKEVIEKWCSTRASDEGLRKEI
jgi:hypothetical protein